MRSHAQHPAYYPTACMSVTLLHATRKRTAPSLQRKMLGNLLLSPSSSQNTSPGKLRSVFGQRAIGSLAPRRGLTVPLAKLREGGRPSRGRGNTCTTKMAKITCTCACTASTSTRICLSANQTARYQPRRCTCICRHLGTQEEPTIAAPKL